MRHRSKQQPWSTTLTPDFSSPEHVTASTAPLSSVEQRRTTRRHIVFAFGVAILLAVAWKLLHVLEIIYVSALFAVVLMPVVQQIQRLRLGKWSPSRPIAIVLLLTAAALALTAFLFIGLPPVLRNIREFSADLPQRLPIAIAKIKRLPLADKLGLDQLAQKSEDLAAATASYILASAPTWIKHVLDLLTAFVLCIYFMLEGEHAYAYLLAFFRPKTRTRLDATMQVAEHRMSKWLLGQGALMLILWVCSTVVFGFLHVRYFFLLGGLMGLFNIVPVAGGVITILLAGAVAALDSWSKLAGVFIFYAIYIQIENAYLTPKIMKTSVDLMGLTVLVALLVGTDLAGVTGALVAVPSAALIAVMMDEYMVQKDAEAQQLAGEAKGPADES